MQTLQNTIETAFDRRDQLSPDNTSSEIKHVIQEIIALLDSGELRVAEKINQHWVTHEWLKKAILLLFKTTANQRISAGYTEFFDKVPLKFFNETTENLEKKQVRIVPSAIARRGAYLAPNTILMPSYINIGAYIDRSEEHTS